MVLTTVDQAIFQATASPSGPVHLNCMFREPLTPEPVNAGELKQESLKPWLSDQKPYTIYTAPEALATNPQTTSVSPFLNELQEAFKEAHQPFITIGALNSQNDIEQVSGLCKVLNVPFYADISSGLRLSSFKNHLAHLDLLLLSDVFSGRFRPDVYLHIGGPMVSKRIQQHMAGMRECKKYLVKNHPYRYDAFHQFTRSIQWSSQPFCEMFTEKINPGIVDSPKWLAELSEMVSQVLKETFSDHCPVDERSLPYLVSGHQTPGQALFLSNSMPIRDMDMFGVTRENRVQTATNRGASGIDGIISSAIGFMHGVKKSTTLVIGDLSFMHDMNAIYHLRNSDLPLILIVINNGGGGIFSFLPISSATDIFNEYFETPHEQDFQSIAGLAGLEYACPISNASFVKVYNQAQHAAKSTLIEIRSQTTANFNAHKELYTKVIQQLQEYDYPD
jgi:2-succinyl-5-enolpyruvyl-6-hydroxy-3-cyclohexene-1-carboxylate synthase